MRVKNTRMGRKPPNKKAMQVLYIFNLFFKDEISLQYKRKTSRPYAFWSKETLQRLDLAFHVITATRFRIPRDSRKETLVSSLPRLD